MCVRRCQDRIRYGHGAEDIFFNEQQLYCIWWSVVRSGEDGGVGGCCTTELLSEIMTSTELSPECSCV